MTALGVRIGGDTVGPGQARALAVPLPHRRGPAANADKVPALAITGHRPGPRVTILAGVRGFEVNAARLVSGLQTWLAPAEVTGTIVLVPVFRPGGRFAAGGRPVKPALVWQCPGDPTGPRAAREAFAVSSALIGDSALVLTVTEADPGRVEAVVLKGDLDDPGARRLLRGSGAAALLPARRRPAAPARPEGGPADAIQLELAVPPAGAAGTADGALDEGAAVVARLLHLAGVWSPDQPPAPAPRPPTCRHASTILASTGGFLETLAPPGTFVAKGEPLARISPPLGRAPVTLVAPQAGLVLEAPARAGTRRGAKLFVLGRLPRPPGPRTPGQGTPGQRPPGQPPPGVVPRPPARPLPAPPAEAPGALHVGWVEHVSLPDLGLEMLAKIDTGARTSALHVTRIRAITDAGTGVDSPRRPLLELTIPRRGKRLRTDRVMRVRVRDFVQIKDSSGRSERRPVIETTLRLGDVKRKVRVTLTDRGDMTYPMLIGRTALGAGVLIDPSRRFLLAPETGRKIDRPRKLT